jgi:LAS superfamily LD-carboxypeptidase LdcB
MLNFEQLSGQREDHLVEAEPGHKLLKQVVGALSAMREAAAEDDIGLDLVSSFRSFQRQLRIWNEKWHGLRPILDEQQQPLDPQLLGESEKLFAILRFSALPGTSRHHWGSDFDVFDARAVHHYDQPFQLISSEYEPGGPCFGLSQWLDKRAAEFGFYRPYTGHNAVAPEPWHLSHQQTSDSLSGLLEKAPLQKLIENSEIAGKESILEHLDKIIRCYVRLE